MTKLENTDLESLVPQNLKRDKKIINLARALDKQLKRTTESMLLVDLTSNLEYHSEDVIDHLLWEMHVEEHEGLALARSKADKIRLLENAIEIHRYKGTAYAVELGLRSIGINCEVVEWFEYGGDPFFFKVSAVADISHSIDFRKTPMVINGLKNVRSHLDKIEYISRGKVQTPNFQNATNRHRAYCYFGRKGIVLDGQYWNLDGTHLLENDIDPIYVRSTHRSEVSMKSILDVAARIILYNKVTYKNIATTRIRVNSNFWFRKGIFLDGSWIVDGENKLNAVELKEKKPLVLAIKSKLKLRLKNTQKFKSNRVVVKKNWWTLNGERSLGDSAMLNASIREEVI